MDILGFFIGLPIGFIVGLILTVVYVGFQVTRFVNNVEGQATGFVANLMKKSLEKALAARNKEHKEKTIRVN